jgi:hypothetical protein
MLARELCIAGCLFYELFTTSIQYCASACETALKHKFTEALPLPCRLTKSGRGQPVEEKILVEQPATYQLLSLVSRGWKLPSPYSKFRPSLGYLIPWGLKNGLVTPAQERWFQHRLRMRNTIAHGHDMVVSPSWALGTLQQTTVTLNNLFLDPEISAYDKEVRRKREERDREWSLEVEDMLRSSGEAPNAESETELDPVE